MKASRKVVLWIAGTVVALIVALSVYHPMVRREGKWVEKKDQPRHPVFWLTI